MRVLAWSILLAIVLSTLSPLGLRPRIDIPVDLERAGAFGLLGMAFALAYPRHIWWAVALVLCGAVALEILQTLRPDRHGREADATVKLAGATIGLTIGWLVTQRPVRRR